MKRLLSWNVNGLRAIERKGLVDWMQREQPDIVCLQETKAHPDQLSEALREPAGYHAYFATAEKKGYSGIAVYSRAEPLSVQQLGVARFDSEGRVLILEYPEFYFIGAYFPNSQDGGRRLAYKLEFCDTLFKIMNELTGSGCNVVLSGDYNIAHRPIDLAHPEENEGNAGYLPEEREWMERFIGSGYVDTFRAFTPDPHNYTWWSYRAGARRRNIGWRIDYHCVNAALLASVERSIIRPEVAGSDHCPIELVLGLPSGRGGSDD